MIRKTIFLLTLAALFLVAPKAGAQGSVTGRVTDSDGEPLMGVVVMASSTNATMTDNEGRYSIKVTSDATLEFSCLGYATVSEKVGGRAVLNVVLEEDTMAIEETVIVGYGTQKKVNLTGSVSTISSESLDSRPIMTLSAGLPGLAAGMMVKVTSSEPGAEGATIRIRGNTTLNTNTPLVLVDGVEWGMGNINTQDVASISVLKDASSTAIYGSRAANGVILITTKTGGKEKAKIEYSFTGVFQEPHNKLSWVSDYATYMELMNEGADNMGVTHPYSDSSIATWRAAAADPYGTNDYGVYNYMAYPNTDWFEAIFNTGFSYQHNLSISGGGDKVKYLMSLGYLDNEGVMNILEGVESRTTKVDFRANIEAKLNDWITAGMKIFGNRQTLGLADTGDVFDSLNGTNPSVYPGTVGKFGQTANAGEEVGGSVTNLYISMYGLGGHDIYNRFNGTAYVHFKLYEGLTLELMGNYQGIFRDRNTYTRQTVRWDYTTNTEIQSTSLENATNTNRSYNTIRANTEAILRYNGALGKHEFGGLAGFTTTSYNYRAFSVAKKGAVDWTVTEMSAYTDYSSSSSSTSEWSLMSFFGRVNYAYDGKYLFEANLRADGSSRFAKDSRWGVFPSVSAGWNMHKENFLKNVSWLSNLKLRGSFGVVGNNETGNYSWQATYSTVKVVSAGSAAAGLIRTAEANETLEWETTYTYDFGVDFGFLKNKLTGEADVYTKYTDGILYVPSMYITMGNIDGAYANIAAVRNYGFEVSISYRDKIGKNFNYGLTLNFDHNYSKVAKYKGKLSKGWTTDEDGNLTYENNLSDVSESGFSGYILEGHVLGEHYLYKCYKGTGAGYTSGDVDINAGPTDGIIRTEADMAWVKAMIAAGYSFVGVTTVSKDQLWYGDRIYQDLDGDGNYGDSDDRAFNKHTSWPKYNLGFTLNASYKGFDFSAVFSGAFKFWLIWNTKFYNTTRVYGGNGIATRIANDHYFYDPDNPVDSRTNIHSKNTRLTYNDDLNNALQSDFYEYRGDYLKLKNIQLGYTIPSKITQKVKVQRFRVFASMENIFTITNYPGMDPEIGTSVSYPLMKSYSFGAQISF